MSNVVMQLEQSDDDVVVVAAPVTVEEIFESYENKSVPINARASKWGIVKAAQRRIIPRASKGEIKLSKLIDELQQFAAEEQPVVPKNDEISVRNYWGNYAQIIRRHLIHILQNTVFHYVIISLVIVDLIVVLIDLVLGQLSAPCLTDEEMNQYNATEQRETCLLEHSVHLSRADAFLFYFSVLLLTLFVLEVFLSFYAFGWRYYKNLLYLLDASIVLASFIMELYFHFVAIGRAGRAASAIIILRLWKIIRAIHAVAHSITLKNRILIKKIQQMFSNVDYNCLEIYNENNIHLSMAVITEKQEGEQEHAIGYNCVYCYGIHRLKLEFDITNNLWRILPIESYEEEEQILLDSVFDDIHSLTLDQQIQVIIKRFDQHFDEVDQNKHEREYENKMSISAAIFQEDHEIKYKNNELIELTSHKTSLTIPEDDEQQKDIVDYGFHSFITGSRSKFSGLAPPPVAPRRSRQNSTCSTQSSVRYASFIPPPTAPIRRRRVIESILLYVQRKKKPFEKVVDVLRGTEIPTMHELGLEFLRVYDGKFNYREGHKFIMSYRKKTWFLTIENIKFVECVVGDIGPRSVLLLCYKGQYTSVHV